MLARSMPAQWVLVVAMMAPQLQLFRQCQSLLVRPSQEEGQELQQFAKGQ